MTTEKDAAEAVRSVTDYGALTYAWVLLLSVWGGAVSFINKVRSGAVRPFNIVELIGELVVSGFVGVLTFWICESAGFDQLVTAVCIGITSHMGTRALFGLEQWATRKLGMPDTPPAP